MTAVRIPPVLAPRSAGQKQVEVDRRDRRRRCSTRSSSQYPALREQLLTADGELNRFVNVYVNGRDVRYEQELATAGRQRRTRSCCCPRWRAAEATLPWP